MKYVLCGLLLDKKSAMLATTFLPPRPLMEDTLQFVYPEPVCVLNNIPREQIERQLARLKPYKALEPNGIPNIVLTKCANILTDRLYNIYRAILKFGIYFDPWKLTTMVVLQYISQGSLDMTILRHTGR